MSEIPGIQTHIDMDVAPGGEFTMQRIITQDNIPTLTANQFERFHGGNGFNKSRTLRKLASIPLVAVEEAAAQGYNLDDKADLHRFLGQHPEFMTVEAINTRRAANIIIK